MKLPPRDFCPPLEPLVEAARRAGASADAGMLSRAQGCLLGVFVGDALGAQVEFSSSREVQAGFPAGVRELRGGGPWDLLPGQGTDDSDLALLLGVEALLIRFTALGLPELQKVTIPQGIIRTAHFVFGSLIFATTVAVALKARRGLVTVPLPARTAGRLEGAA